MTRVVLVHGMNNTLGSGPQVIKLAALVHSVCFAGPDHLIVACAPGIVSVRPL